MFHFIELCSMSKAPGYDLIATLRRERRESLEVFGLAIGVPSKGRLSEIERGLRGVTQAQALAIEALSGGRIDAAVLNAEIAAARAGFQRVPVAANDTGFDEAADDAAAGEIEDGLVRTCFLCERRLDLPGVRDCTAVDCPHAAREAA